MLARIWRGEGTVEDGRVAVELTVEWGTERVQCVATVRADRIEPEGEEAVSALAHAASWTVESNGIFGRKGIRLPIRKSGTLEITDLLVDEAAREEGPTVAGDLLEEFDPDER